MEARIEKKENINNFESFEIITEQRFKVSTKKELENLISIKDQRGRCNKVECDKCCFCVDRKEPILCVPAKVRFNILNQIKLPSISSETSLKEL